MSPIDRHIDDHLSTIEALRTEIPAIEAIGRLLVETLKAGGCVFWLGNGGSAADCQHMAAELVGRFEQDRPGMASLALTTDTSILTSVGNDYGFEQIFARQVRALCKPGDLVIGLSTSGNSPNVLRALEAAREIGARTAGFSGRGGGKLRELTDACLVVPSDNTARIQEAHALAGHILCDLAEREVARPGRAT